MCPFNPQVLDSNPSPVILLIAAFLGWGFDKVKDTLAALELIERKVMGDTDCDGLSAMNV